MFAADTLTRNTHINEILPVVLAIKYVKKRAVFAPRTS